MLPLPAIVACTMLSSGLSNSTNCGIHKPLYSWYRGSLLFDRLCILQQSSRYQVYMIPFKKVLPPFMDHELNCCANSRNVLNRLSKLLNPITESIWVGQTSQ
ncbi:hypothetical protein L873DRAFT_1927793 [Choiromyces venosus 120613-1]|uniref:Uncharacterized protein n=1 Tax=Choiromyces venosus 120613-1 TaxID=1336337 RepID=A0A3N4KFC4_9PEZI|nr:hypothetical protein L873DRAFT_1927793 [Choiromyces venosus 120613-1]